FPTAHRYEIRTRADVVGQDIYEGVTESISASGARVKLQRDMGEGSQSLRYVDVIFPGIRNLKIKSRVVEYRDNVLRLKFKDLSKTDREYLMDWMQSQTETRNEKPG
ncbi:MAG: PilZ domain-containing protein, partial [Bdellovibrio sp.]